MKKPEPSAILRLILDSASPDDAPRLLHDVIAEHAFASGLADDLNEALEFAEELLVDVRTLLVQEQADAESQGVVWVVEVYGTENEYVRGSSHSDPSLTEEVQRARANRRHLKAIRSALLDLKPDEFERACTAILGIMGCRDPHTSPIRDDGGIDFYGRLELKGRLDSSFPYGGIDHRLGLWLVGQAKHYPTRPIQTAHLRELVGSVELARTGGAIHTWEQLALRPFDAVVQLVFTTGNFARGAQQLLSRSGLVAMNGDQISALLADAGVGIDSTSFTFDLAVFRNALGL